MRDEIMNAYVSEFLGTMLLIVLGNSVVANVLLPKTKGHASGWIAITVGWGLSVYVSVLCFGSSSGAHINPAVTIGLAAANAFPWNLVAGYIIAQMLGAMFGAYIVYELHRDHFILCEDPDLKLATFSTGPAIRNLPRNVLCETVATFVLVFAALSAESLDPESQSGLATLGAIRAGFIVFAIGITLGGTTGYAINPARDLGPRIVHAICPIAGKRDSDWGYAIVPVLGPILGGLLAALVWTVLSTS